MKQSTKRKIIEWVTKLLQYYPPMEIPIETKVFEIVDIQVNRVFDYPDKYVEGWMDYVIRAKMIDELFNSNLVSIKEEFLLEENEKKVRVDACVTVIKRQIK